MKKLLIAEDDILISDLFSSILEQQDYAVTIVSIGSQVLSTLEKEKHDLLILDIMLPEINGLEICKMIRKHTLFSKLPIIISSANDQQKDIETALNAGANTYLRKPFERENLLKIVEDLLR